MKKTRIFSALSVLLFMILIIIQPRICAEGAAEGLILCGKVIIPSLFPFTVCVIFIQKIHILNILNFIKPFTEKIFKLTPHCFSLLLLSFLGGYPIGAKLLEEEIKNKTLDRENAAVMLNYCVNAGPAFIILAVGNGCFHSKTIGIILLASHITSAFVLAFISRFFIKADTCSSKIKYNKISAADSFVASVAESSAAVLSICGYVILFSTITGYINFYAEKASLLKYISLFLEISNAVTLTKNVIIISFLLGFGGLCVWCQILTLGKSIKPNFAFFAFTRVIHGILSAVFTAVLLKVFKITVPVATITAEYRTGISGITLSLSMLCMVIILIITVYTKKYTGKILEDLV